MRTERPTPWGFDIWDPRLSTRREAAQAQWGQSDEDTMTPDDLTGDDHASTDSIEGEPVEAGEDGASLIPPAHHSMG
jgi:hypothetical protein